MRAYHRVDPLMDERKSHYTPAQFGAFLKVQLIAGRQAHRGRFRSLKALQGALPATYGKLVSFLVEQGDLIVKHDGSVYVDGWDEWQEGDLTVGERMKRLRERKKDGDDDPSPDRNGDRNSDVTPTVTDTVTEASPTAIGVGISVGVGSSVSDVDKAPSAVAVAKPRAKSPTNEPRLTQRQLDSWANFGPRWDAFKDAWLSRGLLYAPFGAPDDDDTSQRGLLFQVLDARPTEIVRWVREAPTPNAREVITYILERWHEVRAESGVDDDEWEETKREERRAASGAMSRLADLLKPEATA